MNIENTPWPACCLSTERACADPDVHCRIDLVDGEATVYLLHSIAGILHSIQRLLVDICGLYAVDFTFECHYLGGCLLKSMFKLLLAPQRSLGNY